MNKLLAWGILGTASINEKVIPEMIRSEKSHLIGIASRDPKKSESEMKRWSSVCSYMNYEELLEDARVDSVYISLPNHLHFEWAKKALEAGKHVLCEKPLVLSGSDAEFLSNLADEKKLYLAEGFMYRHHEQTHKILSLVQSGALGNIRRIRGSFHITVAPGPNIRTAANTGGGAMWDIGCYLVNFMNAVMGSAPKRVYGKMQPRDGYDELFSGILEYESGATAHLDCGFLGPRMDEFQILGETGWTEILNPIKPGTHETFKIYRRKSKDARIDTESFTVTDSIDFYSKEIQEFTSVVLEGRKPTLQNWESVAGVKTAESLLLSARENRPVEIP